MNSISSWLEKAVPNLGDMKDFLEERRRQLVSFKDQFPDFAEQADKEIAEIDAKIAVLDSVASSESLALLAVTVYNELASLPKEGLRPSQSPGNVTGG